MPDYYQGPTLQCEVWLTVSLHLKNETSWASAGHEIAWAQICVQDYSEPTQQEELVELFERPIIEDDSLVISVSDSHSSLTFDKQTARITSWLHEGQSLLLPNNGPRLTFWRAPTDNDNPQDAVSWRSFRLDSLTEDVRSVHHKLISEESGIVQITIASRIAPPILAWAFDVTTTYLLYRGGKVQINANVQPQGPIPPTLPRVGLELNLLNEAQIVKWFGRGPGQSYRDSKTSAKVGLYQAPSNTMMTDYDVPQENGNRTSTRWVQVLNEKGHGLEAKLLQSGAAQLTAAERGFDFAVQKHSAQALTNAKHPYELPDSEDVILRLDAAHHGLGSGSCGPKTWGDHILHTQEFSFEVTLKYVTSKI
jgi:beta-galactosidase